MNGSNSTHRHKSLSPTTSTESTAGQSLGIGTAERKIGALTISESEAELKQGKVKVLLLSFHSLIISSPPLLLLSSIPLPQLSRPKPKTGQQMVQECAVTKTKKYRASLWTRTASSLTTSNV